MNLYDLALSVPWAITSEALEAMLSIAAREPLPREEIAARMYGPQTVAMRLGTKRDDSKRMTMRDGVARIAITGPIYRYADMFSDASGGVTTEALAMDLSRALDDPAVRAILLAVDSPGGEATGIGELADAIAAGNQRKPIGAYVEGYGASAAYWLASAAEIVGVDASALVGSIGTVLGVSDPTKRQSARIDFVSRQSPKKRPDPTTEAGRAVLQQMVDDLTEVFIQAVMRQRGMSYEQVTALEGGMIIGAQAVSAGFADMVTSEEAMLVAMRQRADQRQRMPVGGTKPMDWKNFWGGLFDAAKDAQPATLTVSAIGTGDLPAPADLPAAPEAPAADVARLTAEIARLKADSIAKDAAAFADTHIRAGRALPAERDGIIALYAAAATVADGGELLGRLSAAYEARPGHILTEELLPVDAGALPLDRGANDPAKDKAEADKHLGKTSLGRAVLARRKG